MVVDDEEFSISAMRVMMQQLDVDTKHHVDFCIDGEEAIAKVVQSYEQGFQYQIIFTDFNMPKVDGIDATKMIREILKDKFKLHREE